MKLAIDKVRDKEMSVREAADTFSVPRQTNKTERRGNGENNTDMG
jgi:hypothetical protein